MKINIWILGILAIAVTACGQAKFSGLSAEKGESSEGQDGSGPKNGSDEYPGNLVQPSEPAPGQPQTYGQAQCKWALLNQNLFVAVADGITITDSIGNMLLKGRHVKEVKDMTGNMIFLGTSDDAKIDHLGRLLGNLIVCNADIGVLDGGSTGNVVVVGGSIGEISNFTGNLVGFPF